ncbi:MAG: thiamine diphosphokinase [Candidatus Thermoplasmatota archaeon]|nr:thiamine diphosphokinase [Candidatus Thermoplasmatota archaeon]MEC7260790.1 thiamine diphosphokinase [Candidatus Thermoplasmatota archaeon]
MSKVLIVANGEWPKQFDLETVGTYRVVVALDGAANRLIGGNMIPDVLLGDLDSVSASVLEQCKASGITIVQMPDQQSSDISKGLEWVQRTYPDLEVDIIGVEIGRYDHHLAAYSALFECNSDATILLDGWQARRVTQTPTNIETEPNSIFSLIPFGNVTGATIKGCQFSLNNESLTTGTRGISNKATGRSITVSVESGDLLLLIMR